MKTKAVRILGLAAGLLLLLLGCSKNKSMELSGYAGAAESQRIAVEDTGNDGGSPEPSAGGSRKLIRSANITIEAASEFSGSGGIQDAVKKIEQIAGSFGGYIERSSVDQSSVQITIRVPSESYGSLLSSFFVLGKVISSNENTEDVTLKYYDLEGRLATKKTLLTTFQTYLGQAKNIEEIMQIETRIAELQNEIDWLGTRLAELSNLIDYTTISVYLFNAREARPYTLGDRILRLFGSFGDFASSALVVIVGIIIFVIPLLVLVIFAYWLLLGKAGLLKKAFRLAGAVPRGKTEQEKD